MNFAVGFMLMLYACFLLDFSIAKGQELDIQEGEGVPRDVSLSDSVYSEWSPWRRCTRKCRQKRTRRCVVPSVCGDRMIREDQSCRTGRCLTGLTPKSMEPTEPADNFRILYHLNDSPFSDWSPWSPCSTDCITRRSKQCRLSEVCGSKTEEEVTICFSNLPQCRRPFRNRGKKAGGTSNMNRINPLNGIKCGVSPLASNSIDIRSKLRIIGGREAKRGSWPWQLAVLNQHREPFCGATLLSASWALTAAHCLRTKLIVRSGDHDLMTAEGTEQESTVAVAFAHPDYDPDVVGNDIALLRLRHPLVFDNYTQPACLPAVEDTMQIDDVAKILGWGKRISTSLYGTDNLYQADVPLVDPAECRDKYQQYKITNKMVCAGYKNGRADACSGDSGGPLLKQVDDKWTVYGVTSFGDGCGEKGKYGIYTFVPKYVKWINRVIARRN